MLSLGEIQAEMALLYEWALETNVLVKILNFGTFRESLEFVNKVGEITEKLNHHPDILINYQNVKLSLTTHAEGGLTKKDFELAREIDKIGFSGKKEEFSEVVIGDMVRRTMNLSHTEIDELWCRCGWKDENRGSNKSLPNWRISEMKDDESVTKKVIESLINEVSGEEAQTGRDFLRNLKDIESKK